MLNYVVRISFHQECKSLINEETVLWVLNWHSFQSSVVFIVTFNLVISLFWLHHLLSIPPFLLAWCTWSAGTGTVCRQTACWYLLFLFQIRTISIYVADASWKLCYSSSQLAPVLHYLMSWAAHRCAGDVLTCTINDGCGPRGYIISVLVYDKASLSGTIDTCSFSVLVGKSSMGIHFSCGQCSQVLCKSGNQYVCMYVCMYVCTCICTYVGF